MQSLIIFSLTFFMIFTGTLSSLASRPHRTDQSSHPSISQQIKSKIAYPDFARRSPAGSEHAALSFTIDETGMMDIQEIECSEVQLKEYILDCLEEAQLELQDSQTERLYALTIIFTRK